MKFCYASIVAIKNVKSQKKSTFCRIFFNEIVFSPKNTEIKKKLSNIFVF